MIREWFPQTVGLELTLACPHRCVTCGSNAGQARTNELTLVEWFAVIDELAALGTERVTLLGGEPLTYPHWEAVARQGIARGIDMEMVTSANGLDETTAERIATVGLSSVTISIDGTESVHDEQRRCVGSYRRAMRAIAALDALGVPMGVTTQINSRTLPVIEALGAELEAAGVEAWQIQPTIPTGRAAGTELALTPERMVKLYETVQRMVRRPALCPHFTDGFGWFTHDDVRLRTPQRMPPRAWIGCQAGLRVLGITSDGRVKGCLSMPDHASEGSLREETLTVIWRDSSRFAYNRGFDSKSLSFGCARCDYGEICRGGCTAMAMAVSGKPHASHHCLRLLTEQ